MLIAWHFWLVFLATGVLLVVLAWAGSRRRRLSPRQIAAGGYPAACGSCGYDLTGLPGHVCPECGSDLDLVGRLSARFYRWASAPVTARLIVWTIAIAAFAAGFVYAAVEYALPRRQQYRVIADWIVDQEIPGEQLVTARGTYASLRIRADGSFTRRLWPTDGAYNALDRVVPDTGARLEGAKIELDLNGPPQIVEWQGERHYAHRKPPRQGLVYLEPADGGTARVSRASAAALDEAERSRLPAELDSTAALLMALDQAGYEGEQGTAEALAADLSGQLDAFLRYGGSFPPQTGSVWQSQNMTHSVSRWRVGTVMSGGQAMSLEPLPLLLTAGFWLAVWLAGLPFILRKRPLRISKEPRDEAAG